MARNQNKLRLGDFDGVLRDTEWPLEQVVESMLSWIDLLGKEQAKAPMIQLYADPNQAKFYASLQTIQSAAAKTHGMETDLANALRLAYLAGQCRQIIVHSRLRIEEKAHAWIAKAKKVAATNEPLFNIVDEVDRELRGQSTRARNAEIRKRAAIPKALNGLGIANLHRDRIDKLRRAIAKVGD